MHLFSFKNIVFIYFPFELLCFIPHCSYLFLASCKNEGLPSVANLHCDRIAGLNMAPGLSLARTNTNISHTLWSYQNEPCLGCFLVFVCLPFLSIPNFCMCFNYDKWFCLNIGCAWKVFYSSLSLWMLGVIYCRWVMYTSCFSHSFIHWQFKEYRYSKHWTNI